MINENQYRLLCELTDNLLNVDGVKTERVAISMLHVMRAHPIFLLKYEGLFEEIKSGVNFLKSFFTLHFKPAYNFSNL